MSKKVEHSNPYASMAMLVSVGFANWSARKFDKDASAEITDKHNVDKKAVRANKKLFLKSSPELEAVNSAISAAQQTYYDETLPWSDDGCRLLPSSNFLAFSEAMRSHIANIEELARKFADKYPQLVEEAKADLNSLWKAEDYPPASEIASRFGCVVKIYPVPIGSDFRVNLAKEHVDLLRSQIDEDTAQAIEDARLEGFGLLFDALTESVIPNLTAKNPKRSIKDVLVENTLATCARVKRLNMTKDAKLDDIAGRIKTHVCCVDGSTLRKDEAKRLEVVKAAAQITAELAAELGIDMPQAKATKAPASTPESAPKAPKSPKASKKPAKATPKAQKASKPAPKITKAPANAPVVTMAEVDALASNFAAMMGM
jgi:hypothetical protein